MLRKKVLPKAKKCDILIREAAYLKRAGNRKPPGAARIFEISKYPA
jgi:hypothetical protein